MGALTALVFGALASVAAESDSGQLPPELRWTNSLPHAYAKNNRIRLFFSNETFAFNGKWKRPRVHAQEFSYVGVTLKRDDSPPRLPSSSFSTWHEVRTLTIAESENFLLKAASRLMPKEAGHGIYFQYALGDAVLYRDAAGEMKLVRFEDKPADVVIDRRYGREEITSAIAVAMEADVRAAYPNDKRFLALWVRGQPRMSYVDFEQRQAIILLIEPPGHNPDRPVLGKNIKTLVSFAVIDHVFSFIKNPVSSSTRTVHQALQWGATIFEPRLIPRGSPAPLNTNAPGMDLAEWEKWLDKHTDTPRERGAVRLFINGEEFYPHLERRIAEAQNRINVHICIFDRDDVAVQVADWLKARSTNIEVKVIYDRLNSRGAGAAAPATPMAEGFVPPDSIDEYLRKGGRVHVHPQLNPGFSCDHSKIILFDGRYAQIGGMNFGREYRYEWHDLMAEVEGPVVASIQRQFDKKWAQTSVWGDCGLAVETLSKRNVGGAATDVADTIELRRLYTKTFERQIRRAELSAINRAKNYIFLENAYLYSNDMVVALTRARLRGVDVRVILPAENDFGPGHASNLVRANYLRQHGVRVYLYPGMSHIKALMVDDWVCFGSANFDSLSLRLNRECNLATSDPRFAAEFRRRLFDPDFARSREVSSDISVDFSDHLINALITPL